MLFANTEYDELVVVGESLADVDLRGSAFLSCRFERVGLAGGQLSDTTFEKCSFVGCDLSNANLVDSSFDTVTLTDSKLLGASLAGATLRSVQARDTLSRLTSFFRASVRDSTFTGCDLRDADFREARIVQSTLVRCDLSSTSFVGADVRQLDIRGSSLDGSVSLTQCRGFVVETAQLVPLAAAVLREIGAQIDDGEIPDVAELPGGHEVVKLLPPDKEAAEQGLRQARARLRAAGTASDHLQ